MNRIIQIPMDYQPQVGQVLQHTLFGKVVSVRVDPMSPEQIVVDLELQGQQDPFVHNQQRGWDIPVQTGSFGG